MKTIKVLGRAGYEQLSSELWLKSYADTPDGAGHLVLTNDPAEAMTFKDGAEAMQFWRQQSKSRPKRRDGKPNRPLTAYSVEIEEPHK